MTDRTQKGSEAPDKGMKEGPSFKFLVGLLAGLGLVFLPQFMAAWPMSASRDVSVALPGRAEWIVGISVALFIAFAMMFLEWHIPAKPWDTFVKALSLPALFMGAVTALGDASKMRDLGDQLTRATRNVDELAGISVIEEAPESGPGSESRAWPRPADSSNVIEASVGMGAFEALGAIGLSLQESKFLIVVARAPTAMEAKRQIERLLACCPAAVVYPRPVNDMHLILESNLPLRKVDAQERVLALKRRLECSGISPFLLRVQGT